MRHANESGNAAHADPPLTWSQRHSEHGGFDHDDNLEFASPLSGDSRRPGMISPSNTQSDRPLTRIVPALVDEDRSSHEEDHLNQPTFSHRARRYFRPIKQRRYYIAAIHLLILNFPFALATWICLFVTTVIGTALLVLLPLGALVCWLALFGSRVAARVEITLQTRYHGPLSTSPPHVPLPYIGAASMTRREDTEAHTSVAASGSTSFLWRFSAIFTDAASYHILLYFLIVKPAIALLIFVGLMALLPVSIALVVPFPAVLRAIRIIGIAQANFALENLS